MSPSPGDSGWLPVQNVMPPSEAISTGRPYSRTLRAVHGAITRSAPTAINAHVAQAPFREQPQPEQQQEEQVRRSRQRGEPADHAAQEQR